MDLATVLLCGGTPEPDPSVLPRLRQIRRHGPGKARRAALLALLRIGGEDALDAADLDVLRRLIEIKRPADRPVGLDACFNAWLAVRGGDQHGIRRVLGLDRSAPVTYALGATLVAHLGQGGPDPSREWRHVLLWPPLDGWTVVSGPSCDPDTAREQVEQLSVRYGEAQSFFYGDRSDDHAWLIARDGRVVRWFDSADPELCTGEPLPVERRVLAELGLTGLPDDLADFTDRCPAPRVAAAVSVDPLYTGSPPLPGPDGRPLIAWPAEDDGAGIFRNCERFAI